MKRNEKFVDEIEEDFYMDPPMPQNYRHVCGEWNNGFVIERNTDGSQFVWVPVGSLDNDGTLDGKSFSEKFGRRNFLNDSSVEKDYSEPLEGDLLDQFKSVKKYGGFYISRYNISVNEQNYTPQSIQGVMADFGQRTFEDAVKFSASMERSGNVKSHLVYGAEYDSTLAWIIKSGAKTQDEVITDSSEWGLYCDITKERNKPVENGKFERYCANNIFDLAGNLKEFTQERHSRFYCVIRGGSAASFGNKMPVAYRDQVLSPRCCIDEPIGYRIALWIR